jgi:hypothetical protein
MDPGVQQAVRFLRLALEVNLREREHDALDGGAPSALTLVETLVTRRSVIVMMRYSCWPLPALRTVIVASLCQRSRNSPGLRG